MSRLTLATVSLLAAVAFAPSAPLAAQPARTRRAAAETESTYRLTAPALARYTRTLHDYAALVRRDPSVVGDKSETARLALQRFFSTAGMRDEEFSRFTMAMVEAGMLNHVVGMGGKASEFPALTRANAAFVKAHEARFAALAPDFKTLQDASKEQEKKARAAEAEDQSSDDEEEEDPPAR